MNNLEKPPLILITEKRNETSVKADKKFPLILLGVIAIVSILIFVFVMNFKSGATDKLESGETTSLYELPSGYRY